MRRKCRRGRNPPRRAAGRWRTPTGGELFVSLLAALAANVLLAAMIDRAVMVKLILVNIFIIFAVQRCTTASVPESSSIPEQGGEGRGADGRSGQVRHRRTRREAAAPGQQWPGKVWWCVDDHLYKSLLVIMREWIEPLDPRLASELLSSARNQRFNVTSHRCCCVQGQVQETWGVSLIQTGPRVSRTRLEPTPFHPREPTLSPLFCLPVMKNLIKSRTTAGT